MGLGLSNKLNPYELFPLAYNHPVADRLRGNRIVKDKLEKKTLHPKKLTGGNPLPNIQIKSDTQGMPAPNLANLSKGEQHREQADIFFEMDQDLNYIYWDKASEELTGISAKDAIGKSIYTLFPKTKGSDTEKAYLKALKTKLPQHFPSKYQIGKQQHYFEISAYPTASGLSVFAKDITESKETHETLRQSNILYSTLVEKSNDGIIIIQDELLVYANPKMTELSGFYLEEITGKPMVDFVSPKYRGLVLDRYQRRLAGEKIPNQYEIEIVAKDKRKIPVEINASHIEYKNKPANMAIIHDMTNYKLAQLKLAESEERYRGALDNMLEGCQIIGYDWRYKYLNKAAVQQSRLTKESLFSHTMMELYPGIENTELFTNLRLCMEKRITVKMENQFIFPDLTEGWFELSIEPVPEGIFILSLDITQRKKTENQLRISEERFHLVFDQVPIGIAIANLDFKFIQVNKTMCKMMGYSEKEFASITFKDLTPAEFLAYDMYQLKLLNKGAIDHFERDKQYRHKDGSVFWGHLFVGTIKDDEGKILYYTPCIIDITKRKQAEESLQKYKLIADDSRDIILFLDKNSGKILEANVAATKAYGYSRKQLLNKTIYDIRPLNTQTSIPQQIALADSDGILFESYHRHKDGSIFPVEVSSRGATVNNTRLIVSVIRDITERRKSEEAFKAIYKHQETILATVPDIIAEVDENRVYTWINESGREFFGDDVIGKEASYYFEGEQDTYHKIAPVFNGDENTLYIESWQRRKDGEKRLLGWWSHALKDITGKTVGALSVASDITDRKLMEENLVHSAKEWSITFDSINDMICIVDAGYVIQRVNNAFANSLNLSPVEIIGRHCYELVHATSKPYSICPHKLTLETGLTQTSEYFEENLGIWVEATTSPIFDASHRVTGSVHIIKDISSRKKSEEALKAERETYLSLFNSVSDAIFVHRPKPDKTPGKLLEVNDACVAILEYSRDELRNMKVTDFVKGMAGDATLFSSVIEKIVENQEATFERIFVTKTGREIPVELRARIFIFEGQPTILTMARDISELKKAEAERQKLREQADVANRLAAVGEMAAGIAHEINNPLTGVIGFAELLANRPDLPADIQDSIKIINNGSLRVVEIVKRLLTFARQTRPIVSKVNITDVIDNSLALRSYVLETAGISIIRDYAPNLPWIDIDPAQIQQVFLNLILNAEQSMKKIHEKGTLTVKTKKAGKYLRISFKDDGAGIPPDVMDKIFQPFFTTKDPGQGTGLGLSLSQGIILEHCGKIWAEDNPDGGATFMIELPITTTCEIPAQVYGEIDKAYLKSNRIASALVIDDEPAVRSLLKIILRQDGHKVDECENPEKALEKLKENTYDIIFLDIRMPGMSGTELYKNIISNWPKLTGHIIFITGDTSDAKVRDYLDNHDIPYVTKPFDMSLLKIAINKILNKMDADN
jgi:PAS domain S-box-containing protein